MRSTCIKGKTQRREKPSSKFRFQPWIQTQRVNRMRYTIQNIPELFSCEIRMQNLLLPQHLFALLFCLVLPPWEVLTVSVVMDSVAKRGHEHKSIEYRRRHPPPQRRARVVSSSNRRDPSMEYCFHMDVVVAGRTHVLCLASYGMCLCHRDTCQLHPTSISRMQLSKNGSNDRTRASAEALSGEC